ncbi:hypothetical protein ACOXXX_21445, partial [Thalassococcus sp. BH17M4-6]
ENAKLKRLLADTMLDNVVLKASLGCADPAGSNGSVSRSQRQNLQQPAFAAARWLTLPALLLRGIPGGGSM